MRKSSKLLFVSDYQDLGCDAMRPRMVVGSEDRAKRIAELDAGIFAGWILREEQLRR